MKHLKKFENLQEEDYKIGDYIHLDDSGEEWKVYLDVKIIDITNDNIWIEAQRKDSNQIVKFWVALFEIKRKSTPEEIEECELRKNTSKYNI